MPQEDVIAVFRADIEQYQKDVAEAVGVTGTLDKKVEETGVSTDKFSKKTKTASGSIRILSQGLGSIVGLLGITGRLFGVNTDKIQTLIFASQQFVSIGKKIADTQKLVTAATQAETAAKVADTVATKAGMLATLGSIPVIGVLIGAAVALGVAIWNVVGGKSSDAEITKGLTAATIKLNKALKENIKFRELQKLLSDESGQSLEEYKAAQDELNESIQEEVDEIKEQIKLQKEFNDAKKGGLNDLKRELELLKVNGSSKEIIFKKEKQIRETELADLEERRKALGDFAFADIKLQEEIKDKKNEILVLTKKRETEREKERLEELDAAKEAETEREKERLEELDAAKEAEKDFQKKILQITIEGLDAAQRERDAAFKLEEKEQKDEDDAFLKNQKKAQDDILRLARKFNKDALDVLRERAKFDPEAAENLAQIEKEINDKRIDDAKRVADAIFAAQQEAFDKRQELLNQEIDAQETNIETQRRLAENGLANTLAFEEKRAAELRREQQIEAEKQKRIKLLETFLNSLAEFSKDDPNTALSKALLQVALAQAVAAVFAEEGGIIGEISERSNLSRRHRGGGDVLLHAQKGEGIFSRDEMSNLGRRNFHLLKDAARFPIKDNVFAMPKIEWAGGMAVSNVEVVKELQALRKEIRNQPRENWEVNKFGEYIKTSIENGVTEITKGKMPKPRFK